MSHALAKICLLTCALHGCGPSTSSDSGDDTAGTSDTASTDTGSSDTGSTATGRVDLVPFYESGSAWESNATARAMVDTVFADFEQTLRTSGGFDATIEIYLTDDNPGTAHTTFDSTFVTTTVDGQDVYVVGTWAKIVLGSADANGPAQTNGAGAEFTVHFNVDGHESNAGLLRHELMHGFGAVNAIPSPTVSEANDHGILNAGDRHRAALYDLSLVDANGLSLLGNYDGQAQTFEVQDFEIQATFTEWTDGEAGLFFRGTGDAGQDLDMSIGTFPNSIGAVTQLNEPSLLMSAASHPTWNTIDEPDRAFLRAMKYTIAE